MAPRSVKSQADDDEAEWRRRYPDAIDIGSAEDFNRQPVPSAGRAVMGAPASQQSLDAMTGTDNVANAAARQARADAMQSGGATRPGSDMGAMPPAQMPSLAPPSPSERVVTDRNWSTTRTKISGEENAANADRIKALDNSEATLRAQGAEQRNLADIAHQEQLATNEKEASLAAERQTIEADHASKINAAMGERDKAVDFYEKNRTVKDFWRDKSEGQRAMAAIGMALGAYGAAMTGGSNGAASIMSDAVDRDFEKQRQDILTAREMIEAKGLRVTSAEQAKKLSLEDWHARKEAAFGTLINFFKAKKLERGAIAADLDTDANVAALNEKKAALRQEAAQATRTSVTSSGSSRTATGGAAGGAGSGRGPSDRTVEEVTRLNDDIGGLEQARQLIKDNPGAWQRYQKNARDWAEKEKGSENSSFYRGARGMMQGLGVANAAAEQGIKDDPAALAIHQGMQRVQTSIAKGYGGVITEGDRAAAASSLGALAMDPRQALSGISDIQRRMVDKRDAYVGNRGGSYAAPVVSNTTAPSPMSNPNQADFSKAADWLKANKNHPQYAERQAKLAAMMAASRGR